MCACVHVCVRMCAGGGGEASKALSRASPHPNQGFSEGLSSFPSSVYNVALPGTTEADSYRSDIL